MPSPIQNLIAALTGKAQPKAESVEVTCPSCGHTFDVDVDDNNDNESWRTDDESGDVGESDPDDGDDDSEFEDSMNTPKQKAAEAAELTKALLNVASDRDSVDAQPHEISPAQSVKIVQATKKIVENSPADLLAAALNKAAKEARR